MCWKGNYRIDGETYKCQADWDYETPFYYFKVFFGLCIVFLALYFDMRRVPCLACCHVNKSFVYC